MNTQLVMVAVVIFCGGLNVNGSPATNFIESQSDQTLMNYMMQSRAVSLSGSYANECFSYYIPIFNNITETYKTNYQACITTANMATDALILLGDASRISITNVSNIVCANLTACQQESENLSFFDCYTNLGDVSVRTIYNASRDASDSAASYRESYRIILAQEETCTNNTQRIYVIANNQAYMELDNCFLNGLPVEDSSTTESVTDASATILTDTNVPTVVPAAGMETSSVAVNVPVQTEEILVDKISTSRK